MKRVELLETLDIVKPALADDSMVPMWQCFMFHADSVICYNNAIGIIAPINVGGEYAVNGKTLLGLLENSAAETVDLKLEGQDLTIRAGRSTFKLPWYPKEDFLFEEPEDKLVRKLPLGLDSLKGMELCLKTASKDATQPALMGVCLSHRKKHVTLYSCNGDALSSYLMPFTMKDTEAAFDYMLPSAFCQAVLRTVSETEAEAVELKINEEWALAAVGDYLVYGRLIQNDNPLDHEGLFKSTVKGKPTYVPLPDGLEGALQRAMVVTEAESAKTVLTVEKGRLKLLSETHMGTVRDSLAFEGHPDVEANVSSALLRGAIGSCAEIAIFDNCCVLKGENLTVLLSNMG